MPNSIDLDAIAADVLKAQDGAAQVAPFTGRHAGFDLPAAYQVAHRVEALRRAQGWTPVGRKIGFTNAALWPVFGVDQPIWGTVYDRTLVMLDGHNPHHSLRGLVSPKIEPEIVFRLRHVPAPDAEPAELLAAIEWVAPGFEIVQSHYPDWKFGAADTVATGGLHGRLFLGPPMRLADLGPNAWQALEDFSLALTCNGALRDSGRGANVLGHPALALAHLVRLIAGQAGVSPLRPGEIVTTGTVTGAHSVAAGETWRAATEGLGWSALEVRFTD